MSEKSQKKILATGHENRLLQKHRNTCICESPPVHTELRTCCEIMTGWIKIMWAYLVV